MADVPVSLGARPAPPIGPATRLGEGVAGMVRYMMGVIDREDRLESGTGAWLGDIVGDPGALERSVRDSVLRALRLACDSRNFDLLATLAEADNAPMESLGTRTGLDRPSVAERVGDLTSAGLVTKIPEAGQVAITEAGRAVVGLVGEAVDAGTRALTRELR